jgi:UTP-glucose-1-phosphate uridylyltransferase/mevalonate kinase
LLAAARGPTAWRYAAGVAYVIADRWAVRGADLVVESNLPAAKGLSSSAALCVAVARAFNRLYNLGLAVAGEMDVAHAGERLTGSMCGRMDQCVAFGPGAVAHMTFDGEVTTHRLLPQPAAPLFVVFADLAAAKDTSIILRDLQAAVASRATPGEKKLVDALGARNESIVRRVAAALEAGDAALLGALYEEAQTVFDSCAAPLCPHQLAAPTLHKVIHHPRLRPLIHGAKGVGSQGDGSVQFVARGESEADELVFALQSLGMPSAYVLRLGAAAPTHGGAAATEGDAGGDAAAAAAAEQNPNESLPVRRRVKTAVITAAGFGTRLFPASRSIRPKALMPIIDSDGFVKPLLLHIAELCVREGMERIVIVCGPGDQVDRVREVFSTADGGLAAALGKKEHVARYAAQIAGLESRIEIVVQETPEGFGHAVTRASVCLGDDEPFVLLLGDVAFKVPSSVPSCLRQCLDVFERDPRGRSVIGASDVSAAESGAYGVVKAEDDADVKALRVVDFVEKPDKGEAALLATRGMCKIVLGPYVFTRNVMNALLADVAADARRGGEVQLTPAVARVKDTDGLLAVGLRGKALDTGSPQEYANTMVELAGFALRPNAGE